MNVYSVDKIRNVCVMGHGGEGKTSLIESMLYMTKATDRMGKIADGNTVCDYDPEEIRRKFSISTAVAPVEYGDCKINMLDTPGFFDFEGEVQSALRVCESGLIVVPGKSGPSVGTEKAWKRLADQGKPCAFYISKIDEEKVYENKIIKAREERRAKPYRIRYTKIKAVKWLILIMVICAFTGLLTPLGDTPYTYLYKTMKGNTTENISEHLPLTLINNPELLVVIANIYRC